MTIKSKDDDATDDVAELFMADVAPYDPSLHQEIMNCEDSSSAKYMEPGDVHEMHQMLNGLKKGQV
ncbi:hypothetical protein SAMN02745166_02954 [Prosthecobacter debontii]|uniref:Uncharacterized protein n=1 Tax=Prosthecobacter debontii TaxID=48467 RepID=A0A1T4YCQ5_9BACT|nr:hypothetical protein SAMN02745166_02954 [Prosthecobacter debontii]